MDSKGHSEAVDSCDAPSMVSSLYILTAVIIIVIAIIVCYGPGTLDITCIFHHDS